MMGQIINQFEMFLSNHHYGGNFEGVFLIQLNKGWYGEYNVQNWPRTTYIILLFMEIQS